MWCSRMCLRPTLPFDNLTLSACSRSLCSLGLGPVRDSCQMYLEILLKAKFGVRAELWSFVKRWYPVLTQSFDVVCNDDSEFQRSDFTALFNGAKCLYIWDHKMDHLWLCYTTVKRRYLVRRWARDSSTSSGTTTNPGMFNDYSLIPSITPHLSPKRH